MLGLIHSVEREGFGVLRSRKDLAAGHTELTISKVFIADIADGLGWTDLLQNEGLSVIVFHGTSIGEDGLMSAMGGKRTLAAEKVRFFGFSIHHVRYPKPECFEFWIMRNERCMEHSDGSPSPISCMFAQPNLDDHVSAFTCGSDLDPYDQSVTFPRLVTHSPVIGA